MPKESSRGNGDDPKLVWKGRSLQMVPVSSMKTTWSARYSDSQNRSPCIKMTKKINTHRRA
jgi:hypothetical protein